MHSYLFSPLHWAPTLVVIFTALTAVQCTPEAGGPDEEQADRASGRDVILLPKDDDEDGMTQAGRDAGPQGSDGTEESDEPDSTEDPERIDEEKRSLQLAQFEQTCQMNGGRFGTLPVSHAFYCVKGSQVCETSEGRCPLYVTPGSFAYFDKVDAPAETGGKLVTVYVEEGVIRGKNASSFSRKVYQDMHLVAAELPRYLFAHGYPGLDPQRIYAVGLGFWESHLVGKLGCSVNTKKNDDDDVNQVGPISNIYAAGVSVGHCGCTLKDNQEVKIPQAGKLHVLTISGTRGDSHTGGDRCEQRLRNRAEQLGGCSSPDASWQPITSDNPHIPTPADPQAVDHIDFGVCPYGSISGYVFRGEREILSKADNHFDPPLLMSEVVWNWLQDKTKGAEVDLSE